MYKRKVRIYFFDDGQVALAVIARAYAEVLGGEWLEARAAGEKLLDDRVSDFLRRENISTPREIKNANDVDVSWADLVITIGDLAKTPVPPLSATTQTRHWPLTIQDLNNPEQRQIACDEIRRRVTGVIGGIKLLAKTDSSNTPPA